MALTALCAVLFVTSGDAKGAHAGSPVNMAANTGKRRYRRDPHTAKTQHCTTATRTPTSIFAVAAADMCGCRAYIAIPPAAGLPPPAASMPDIVLERHLLTAATPFHRLVPLHIDAAGTGSLRLRISCILYCGALD